MLTHYHRRRWFEISRVASTTWPRAARAELGQHLVALGDESLSAVAQSLIHNPMCVRTPNAGKN